MNIDIYKQLDILFVLIAHLPQQFHEFGLVHLPLVWLQKPKAITTKSNPQRFSYQAELKLSQWELQSVSQCCLVTWGGLAVLTGPGVAAGTEPAKQDPDSVPGVSGEREVEQGVNHGGGVDSPLHDGDVGLSER